MQGLQDLGFRVQPPQDEALEKNPELADPGENLLEDPMVELDDPGDEGDAFHVEEKHRAAAEQRWKEFLSTESEVESRVLTFALPLVNRKSGHVVDAVAWIYARIRSMQIPILRVHTDRAREFASASFARWCVARDLWHTMSPGDEPTQNSRVERSIGLLKNRVRTLIKASGACITWWPLALRHAAESTLRSQLWQLGIATPTIPGFGVRAVAKSKTWHHRGVPWKFPGIPVRIWGPAMDMSLTSGGVLVQDTEGRWLRTTVARPVHDPEINEYGQIVQPTQAPNNRCGGSSPMACVPELNEAATDERIAGELQPGDELQLWDPQDVAPPRLAQGENCRLFGAEDVWAKFAEKVASNPNELTATDNIPTAERLEVHLTEPGQSSDLMAAISYDPPRHRLRGKQTVVNSAPSKPALREFRAGGEFYLSEGLKLLQHQAMKDLMREESSRLQS